MHDPEGIVEPGHAPFFEKRNKNRVDKDIDSRSGKTDGHRNKEDHHLSEFCVFKIEIKAVSESLPEQTRHLNQKLHQAADSDADRHSINRVSATLGVISV